MELSTVSKGNPLFPQSFKLPLFKEIPRILGYLPGRKGHDAIKTARERCFKYEWGLDMDISKFFFRLDHELLMKAVEWKVQDDGEHQSSRWTLLYIGRWLKVSYQTKEGQLIEGTLQESVWVMTRIATAFWSPDDQASVIR